MGWILGVALKYWYYRVGLRGKMCNLIHTYTHCALPIGVGWENIKTGILNMYNNKR